MMIWLVVLGIVVTLAIFLPPEIGLKANRAGSAAGRHQAGMVFSLYAGDAKAFPRHHLRLQW